MVFCRECQKKVEDCPHFVTPISAQRMRVFDAKVQTLAYNQDERILQIEFKSGQVWQLFDVPAGIYKELCDTTISSFLKFIAQRYKAAPVRTGMSAVEVPAAERCPQCKSEMGAKHRNGSNTEKYVRVLWACPSCNHSFWKTYGQGPERERRTRWH